MTTTVSIRELSRNANTLSAYDYVNIEDKKSHEYKGVFVAPQYADAVKEFLDGKIEREKQERLEEIMQFAGIFSGETKGMTSKEIKASKSEKYK